MPSESGLTPSLGYLQSGLWVTSKQSWKEENWALWPAGRLEVVNRAIPGFVQVVGYHLVG
eukprot:2177321-Amphidinium_carterae.1